MIVHTSVNHGCVHKKIEMSSSKATRIILSSSRPEDIADNVPEATAGQSIASKDRLRLLALAICGCTRNTKTETLVAFMMSNRIDMVPSDLLDHHFFGIGDLSTGCMEMVDLVEMKKRTTGIPCVASPEILRRDRGVVESVFKAAKARQSFNTVVVSSTDLSGHSHLLLSSRCLSSGAAREKTSP
jgi:hypothetical protein